MATLKFKDPSPYVKGPQKAPPVDYLYARWAKNFNTIQDFFCMSLNTDSVNFRGRFCDLRLLEFKPKKITKDVKLTAAPR